MSRKESPQLVKYWLVLILLTAVSNLAFSQTAAPLTSGCPNPSPRHHTLSQRVVGIFFNPNVIGSTSPDQWTVTVGGVSVKVSGVAATENGTPQTVSATLPGLGVIAVQFDASLLANGTANGTHPKYALPGEAIKISFVNTGNTVKTQGSNNPVATFTNLTSNNCYYPGIAGGDPIASDIKFSSEGNPSATDFCAPVNTNFYRWTYAYSQRFRNSAKWTLADQKLNISWGDPSNTTTALAGYISRDDGTADPAYRDELLDVAGNPRILLTYRSGFNPTTGVGDGTQGFSYGANTNICNFLAVGYPSGVTAGATYDGSAVSTVKISHRFDSYDVDTKNTGVLNLDPVTPPTNGTTTNDKVCFGLNVGMRFQDNSTFNCIGNGSALPVGPNAQATPLNVSQRWVRFIYGSIDAPAPGNIPDISVGGVQVTNTTTGALMPAYTANPLLAGGPITRGYVLTGAGGINTPDPLGVIQLSNNATVSGLLSELITTSSAANQAVGQRFYVSIQYWNACNPYSGGNDPVGITTDYVEIVTIPTAPTAGTPVTVCNGVIPTDFGITGAAPNSTVNWYKDNAGVPGTLITSNTASGTGVGSLTMTAGIPGFSSTNAGVYTVWASYVSNPAGIACESPKVAITKTIRESTALANLAIKNPTADCPGTTGKQFLMERPAGTTFAFPTNPIGGATTLNWTVPAAVGTLTSANNINPITVTLAGTAGSGQVTASFQYTTVPACPTLITGSTYSLLIPPTIGTQPVNRTICEGTNTTFAVSGIAGTAPYSHQWQVDTGSGFTNISNGGVYAGATTATLTISNVPFSMNGYKYRDVVTGTCSPAVNSTTRTLTVQPKPAITTAPVDRVICIGASTTYTVVAAGQATLTYQWQVDTGSGFTNISNGGVYSGATSATLTLTNVPVAMNGYRYQVVVTSSSCNPPATSASAALTLQGPTTTISTATPSSVCAGNNLQINAAEAFLNGNFVSRAWTGTYNAAALTTVQLDAILTDGVGGSRRQELDPIFNSAGLGANKTGTYILTLTSKDDNNCTNTATITINVSQLDANILNGFTSTTITSTSLTPAVCASFDLYLDGNPSGGSGTFNNDAWTKISGPAGSGAIGTLLNNANARKPIFNATITGTYVLRYQVQDASGAGCSFNTAGKDVSITVNPLPAATNQTPTVCSDAATPTLATVNLTALNASINPGPSVTIAWFTGYNAGTKTFSGAIGTPTAYVVTNAVAVFARVSDNTTTCPSPATVTYTVNPAPVGAAQTLPAVCGTATINVDPQVTSINAVGGNSVNSTFTWTTLTLNGMTTTIPTNGVGNIAGSLTNSTNTQRTAVFRVTPKSVLGTCTGNTIDISVPVNPVPAIPNQTPTICSGTAWSLNPVNATPTAATVVPAGTQYAWAITTNNTNITGQTNHPGFTNSPFGETLTNTTNTAQSITYTVTPKSTGATGCTGATFTVQVTVNPTPVITGPIDLSICTGSAFSYTPVNGTTPVGAIVPAGITYSWPAPSMPGGITGGTLATGQTTISQTLTNTSTSPGTVVYTVTPHAGTCDGSVFLVRVAVNPTPKLSSTITPPAICSGTFNYTPTTLTTPLTATFTWTRASVIGIAEGASAGNGNISETLTNVTIAPLDVVYKVITHANGCDNSPGQDVTVRVNATPTANAIIGPANVCAGTGNPFFYSVTQHAGSTYSWEVPGAFSVEAAGGGVTSGGGAGPFTSDYFILLKFNSAAGPLPVKVIEKSADGCVGVANVLSITAASSPPTVPISGGNSFCKFQKGVVFSVPQNASSTFTWSVGSGATIIGPAAGTNLYQIIVDFGSTPSTTINVTETNITGCPSNYPTLNVTLVTAPITTASSGQICSGDQPSSVIDLQSKTTDPSNFSWFVKSITSNVTGAFVNDTGSGPLEHFPPLRNVSGTNGTIVYTVTPTASSVPFCMGVAVDMTVTVKPEPVVTSISDQSFCPNVTVNGAVSFPLTSSVAGATINWTHTNPAIGLVATSGAGNISFIAADNITGSDIVSTVTVSATANGCTSNGSNIKTFTITIKPRPVVNAITDVTVCPGDAVSIPTFGSNTSGGETYAWTNDNVSIGLAGSGSGNIAGYFAPANNTGADIVGNISVTATRNGCAGPATAFKITVRPQPVVTTVANQTFCPGDAISIPLSSNVLGATLNWSNNNTAIGLAASGSGNITGTAPANNTGADVTATITVSAVSNGCTSSGSNVKTFTIIIKPTPIVDTVTDITVCSGANIAAIPFTSNIAAGGVTYNWTNSNTAINLGGSGSGPIPAFVAAANTTGAPLVGTISVTGLKNSCSGPVMTFTITINPEPVVTPVTNKEFCPGDAVSIPLTSNVPGATVNWTNNNGSIGLGTSGTGDITFTAPANNTGADITGTITVSASLNSCTSGGTNQKTFTIKIKPTPIVNTITDITACSGGAISTITFAANTGGSETFSWTNDNTTIGLPASGTGNIAGYVAPTNTSGTAIVANISVSASRNSCPGPVTTFKITVNPEPVVTAITNQSFCPGDGVNVPFTSNVPGATISWSNSNTAIGIGASGTGDVVYVAPANNTGADIVGTISVTATKNGCVSTGANSKSFTITIKPTPIVNAISNITVCSGGSIAVSAFGSNIGAGGVTFDWTNDNTAIGLVASGTGNIATFTAAANVTSSPRVATITVTGTKNSCAGPAKTFTITVLPEPVGTSDAIAICSDVAVGVNLSTMMTGGAAASRFNITITNSAGLSASAGAPADGTSLLATEIQNDKWTNLTGVPHDVVYHITPISGGSPACSGATFDLTVTVNPEPIVTTVTNKEFCAGDAVNIALTSNVAGATMNWTSDNASIGLGTTGSGNIVYTAPANNTGADIIGTITVSAVSSGCTSAGSNVKTFTIKIKPTPIVNTVTDVTVCSGGSISAITFAANTGGSETFNWTNDNTSIGIAASGVGNIAAFVAPTNVSGTPMVANIGVSAIRNGCTGPVTTFKITVNPEPVVTAIANQSFCPGDGVNIPFTSNVPGAIISWSNSNTLIGVGASGTGDVVYVAPSNNTGADIVGTITVTASKNSCTSAGTNLKTFTVTIKPTPIVNAISNITVCSGGTITIPAFGSNIGAGAVTFNWTNDNTAIGLVASGTGNITTFASAPNTTSSSRVATISVIGTKNSCSGIARTFTITVLPEPVGTSDAIAICSDAAVAVNLNTMITGGASASRFNITITNLAGLSASAGAPADGNNLLSTEIQNDKWTNTTGTPHDIVYHITPISGGSPACSGATFDLTVTINPEPIVSAVANQTFCPGDPVNIALSSNVTGATMNWSNSNPSIGLGFNGTGAIVYTAPANNTGLPITGTITVTAESAGCTSAGTNVKTFVITIKPTPIVNTVTDVTVCSGGSISAINFAANTGGSETFNWTNDNTSIGLPALASGNISAFVAPVNVSGVPMVANITVTATRLSCSGPPMTFKIIVNPEPVVAAIANQTYCAGEAVNIPFASNVAGATITWTNTNTALGLGSSGGGDIVYVAPGNNTGADIVGTIEVSATKNGCISDGLNKKTFTIIIKPTPIVNAVSNVTVCSGGSIPAIVFGSNVASAGVTFDWTNDNTAVGLAAGGTGNIAAFTAGLNLTATPITATVSIIGTKNTCSGPARTFTITVLPQPVGAPVPVTVCSNAATAINLNTMVSGTAATYNITITNTAGLPASGGSPTNANGVFATEIQDDRWTNVSGSPQLIVYHVTPIGPGSPGCVGATFDITVTINPEPVVAAVPNQEFCPAVAVSLPLTSNVSGATISWTNTNPLIGIGTTGAGDISYTTPANNSGSDIIGTITVSASKDGCVSSGTNIKTFDIKIKPTPIINQQANIVVCSGASIPTINFTSNTAGGETYAWTNSNIAINLASSGGGNIPGYTAPVNLTGAPITGTITVTASKNSCGGPAMVFTITINPEPVVTAVTDKAFCAGDAVNIPLTSNVAGSTISWTNSNASIGISTGGTGDIVYTAPSNNTGADIIGTITVSASKDGCISAGANIKTFQITIKPTPIVNSISDITVCSGQTIVVPAFGSNVVASGVTFNWTNDNAAINLAATGSGNITSFTAATNVSGTPMTANISVTGTKNSCSGPAVSFRITINPEPVVTAVTDKEFCPGQPINIPLVSNVSGSLISWTNSNTLIGISSTGTGDILYTAPANNTGSDFVATINVTAERNSCISAGANSKSFQITIKATPVVATITNINACSGDNIAAIAFTSNADPGVTFNWFNDNTGINLAASGTGNIATFTGAVNTGSVPMIANIRVNGTKNGCTGADQVFKITIFPEPVLGVSPPAPVCSRTTVGIILGTNGTSVSAQSYRLDNIEYSSNGGPFSTTAPTSFTFPGTNRHVTDADIADLIKNDVFTNLSPFTVKVRYTITPISSSNAASLTGCAGDAAQVSIDVLPEPDLDNTLSPAAICSGDAVISANPGFSLRSDPSSVAATSFIIRSISAPGLVAGSSNAGTGSNKPSTAINNDSWINTSNIPVDVTYVVAPVTNGCVGLDENVVVRVNPSPAVKDGLDRVVCNDTQSGIVLQDNAPTSVSADRYDIISVKVGATNITPGGPAVGGLTANAANAPLGVTTDINRIRNDRFVNSTNDRVVVSYTVVAISPVAVNSCRGPAKVITLTVEPQIISASTTTTPVICSGQAIDITFVSPTYSGAPTDPTVTFSYATLASSITGSTVGNNLAEGTKITDILINTTNAPIDVTYRITPRASNASNGVGCTGNFQDIVIRVEPKPTILPIASKTICENTAVGLLLKSNTVPTTGSIKIFVTSTPDPEITGASNNVLVANNTNLGDLLQNSASVTKFVTYHLEVRNVDATNTTICTSAAPVDVVVGVSPTPVFAPFASFAICSGESFAPITINTDTETATPGSTIVTWTATAQPNVSGESNGAGNAFSQVLFNTTGTKQVVNYILNATNISNTPSCAATPVPFTVTVYPNPKVVSLPTSANVCNNGTLSPNPYTIQTSTVAALGTTFDWTVDNGGNADLPVIPNAANQTQINQTFVNNGSFLGTQQYTITAHLTIPGADNPIIDAGLGIDNVCTAQTDAVMVVNVAPQVSADIYGFDIDGNTAVDLYLCRGAKQFVYMDPSGLPLMTIDYEENGTPKQINKLGGLSVLQVSPANTTTYKLTKVTDKFGCSVNPNKTVTVHVDEVDNNFSIVGPNINCSPFPVTFQHNQVAGTSYQWKWLDGPDSTAYQAATSVAGKQIKHTYLNPSPGSTMTFRASLDAYLDTTKYLAGCRKRPVVVEVKIYPTVAPAVFADRDVICSDDQVSFTNSTQGATSNRWFYRVQGSASELEVKTTSIVSFKIPNTSTSNPLVYEVVYQSNNGHCPAPDVVTPITVYRGVDAHFSHTAPTLYIGGHSAVTFTNDSAPVDGADFRYDWQFGLDANPATANVPGPTFDLDYTTPGPKEVTLTATNTVAEAAGLSCFDQYKETINIAVPPLIADFLVVPLFACYPTDITVTENNSTGDRFEWRVLDAAGTAAQSNADLPVFKIPAPGKYTVELTTTNSFTGDQKTATKDVIVYDLPFARFDLRPTTVFVPDQEVITYNFTTGQGSTDPWFWDFGDGFTSTDKEPTHVYKIEGVYDIMLVAKNDHGDGAVCVDTVTNKITAKQGGVTRVPNAFTPNPNGPSTSTGGNPAANSFNDVFLPQVKGAEEFNMQVFDRWGNLIFESNNSNIGWDGYDKNGKLMPAGVYVYKLTLRLSDGQRTTQVGDITMIR
ncbi:MAG: PKD-like domain-containing protein [Bacteroidota bacterium]